MIIRRNIPLTRYNTFGLDYMADSLVSIKTEKEAATIFTGKIRMRKPFLIIGKGSNILFTGDFKGTIIKPEFGHIKIVKEEKDTVVISAGAGISWDKLVEWTVDRKFGGLENLSLIPGLVGAAPVQNIGAYGVEAKDTILKVRTISITDGSVRIFTNEECNFGYRNSIFKSTEKSKYLITRVYFRLKINPVPIYDYGSLKDEVQKPGIPSIKTVRDAVIKIRRDKLPDPSTIGNAGSFFKNPLVIGSVAHELKKKFPSMPCYDDPSGKIKLAAGWLIEQCGWKGKRIGNAGVHSNQALVLVNHGNATGKEIFDLSEMIRSSVIEKFGIELEREVEII